MAATTGRIRIGLANATNPGVAYDAAPGDVWTLLKTGPLNIVIKFGKQTPPVEIWHGATGLPDPKTANGMPCDWDDGSLSIALLTGNSVYYRASMMTQFTYSTDA